MTAGLRATAKVVDYPPESNVRAPVLDPTGTRAQQSGIVERKAMIDRGHGLSVTRQAKLLGISRGTVYYLPQPVSDAALALMRRLDELHLEHPFMGARMLRRHLHREGIQVGRRHVRTLMLRMGIEALCPQPGTSKRHPGQKIYSYLLRKLAITRSNQVWALDTTYIRMARGFVYLTAVVDVASRAVLAHKVATTMEACHAKEILEQAFARYGMPEIVNTDQGSQFTAEEFTDAVLDRGYKLSMDGARCLARQCLCRTFVEKRQVRIGLPEGLRRASVPRGPISAATWTGSTHKGCTRASRTSPRCRPIGPHSHNAKRPHRMNPWCAPSCPPRRSFVASDARRRGQLCTLSTRLDSTYKSRKAVQTTEATSMSMVRIVHLYKSDGKASSAI